MTHQSQNDLNGLHSAPSRSNAQAVPAALGVVGGPVSEFERDSAAVVGVLAYSGPRESERESFFIIDGSAVVGVANPMGGLMGSSGGIRRYKARPGDTLSSVAAQFNITLGTLQAANPGLRTSLRLGQTLIILPVSGIPYNVEKGDTLELIAVRYQADKELVKRYNEDYQKILSSGNGALVLPYAQAPRTGYGRYVPQLPDLRNYFGMPAIGLNWGKLHDVNAVDIANRCGTPVVAAAEGVVVPDEVLGDGASGWNNGYGIFALIEHLNGTKTRYAHLGNVAVRIGDYVNRGDRIGAIGNTGNAHGPTGCHVHFEVLGAKNPFAR